MFGLGFGELLIILVIVLLVFGAGKLPQIGDALGKSIRNFKKSSKTDGTAPADEIEVAKRKEIAESRRELGLDNVDADVVKKVEK
jgi:sec-independent protein translocase protein TatA